MTALDFRLTRCARILATRSARLAADSLRASFWPLAALDLQLTRCARIFVAARSARLSADSLRASFWRLTTLDLRRLAAHLICGAASVKRRLPEGTAADPAHSLPLPPHTLHQVRIRIKGGGHSSWRRCPAPGFHSSLSAGVRATPPRADTGARPKSKQTPPTSGPSCGPRRAL